ncbi:hypothetical protein SDC9_115693 [bioreactor metagenome]|uniref:Uncharacterized protein n=1 Tax=bioreactor metagenome TaxID=1076179 RepID=A0A645BTL6_9ZZZZ
MVDDVDVDVAGFPDDGGADPLPGQQRRQPAASADADHQLGRVHRAGEVDQGGRDVLAHDLVEAATQLLDQRPLRGQRPRARRPQPVLAGHMDRQELPAS